MPTMTASIRPAAADDRPFLERMFLVAANWDPDRPARTMEEWLADDHTRRYIGDWGRNGDVGFIAEADGLPVGAIWRRWYTTLEPGYGFLAEDIPEIAIGVDAAWRGQGIGARLLSALAEEARAAGLAAMSLSVEPANPATRLYLRQGYRIVSSTPSDLVMRLDLTDTPPER